jgi:hypothetical protein
MRSRGAVRAFCSLRAGPGLGARQTGERAPMTRVARAAEAIGLPPVEDNLGGDAL